MARTLHGRLLLVLAGLLVPVGVLFVAITLASARGYYQEITQEQNAGLAASLVEQSDIMLGSTVDQEKLKSLTEMLAMTNPNVEIYVLGEDGAILGGGMTDTRLLADRVELDAIETFLAGGSFPLRGTDPRRRQRTIFSASAARRGSRLPLRRADKRGADLVHPQRADQYGAEVKPLGEWSTPHHPAPGRFSRVCSAHPSAASAQGGYDRLRAERSRDRGDAARSGSALFRRTRRSAEYLSEDGRSYPQAGRGSSSGR